MKSVIFAIVAIAALAYIVWTRESRADDWSVPAWAKAYHVCVTSAVGGPGDKWPEPPPPLRPLGIRSTGV